MIIDIDYIVDLINDGEEICDFPFNEEVVDGVVDYCVKGEGTSNIAKISGNCGIYEFDLDKVNKITGNILLYLCISLFDDLDTLCFIELFYLSDNTKWTDSSLVVDRLFSLLRVSKLVVGGYSEDYKGTLIDDLAYNKFVKNYKILSVEDVKKI